MHGDTRKLAVSRRLRAGLLTLIILLAATLVGAVGLAYYHLGDPDRLKALAIELTGEATGRTLEITGPVTLEISGSPRLSLEGARLSNPAWATEPHLLLADYLSIRIGLSSLLSGWIHVLDFEARGVVLNLEASDDGQNSWDLPATSTEDSATDLNLLLQRLDLREVSIHARLPGWQPVTLDITELTETTDSESHLSLQGSGTLNDEPWRLDGRVGPLDEVLRAGRIALAVNLIVHTTELSVQGDVDDVAGLGGVDLDIVLRGPDARFYGALLDMPEAFSGDIALQAALHPDADGYALNISGHVAEFDVQASAALSDLRNLSRISGQLRVSGPEGAAIARAAGVQGFPSGPFTLEAEGHLEDDLFELADLRLETDFARLTAKGFFPELPETDNGRASVLLEGDDIALFAPLFGLETLPEAAYILRVDLEPDTGRFRSSFALGAHKLQAEGHLGDEPGWSGLDIELQISGPEVADLASLVGFQAPPGPYSAGARIVMDGSAIGLQDIAARLGPVAATGTFRLPDSNHPDRFDASARIEVLSLEQLAHYLQIDPLPDRPVLIDVSVRASAGTFDLSRSSIQLGAAEIEVAGSLGNLASLEGVDLLVVVAAPGFNALLPEPLPTGYGEHPLTLRHRLRGHSQALEIVDLRLDVADSVLKLNGTVTLEAPFTGSHLQLTATGSNFADLVPPSSLYAAPALPYEASGRLDLPAADLLTFSELNLTLGGSTAHINGTIDLGSEANTDLQVEIQGESLADLGRINDRLLPAMPFALATSLSGNENAIDVSSLKARWGDSSLSASGALETGDRPRLRLKGQSELLRLDVLRTWLQEGDAEIQPEDADPSVSASIRMIPDMEIPFDLLNRFDADIDVSISRFEGWQVHLDNVRLQTLIAQGEVTLERFEYQESEGSFALSGFLRPGEDVENFHLRADGTNVNLGVLLDEAQPADTIPRYSVRADLSGSGTTVSGIAGSLDGGLLIYSDGGYISNAALQLWAGDFLKNVVDLLNPFSAPSDVYTQMDCMVLNTRLESGRIKLEPGLIMRTDKVNMFVFGNADLSKEKLDLAMATQARQGIGLSAASIANPYFKVGGTFSAPQLQVDAKNAAVAYGIATATGGMSILAKGLWDRVRGQRNPCPSFMPQT